MSLWSDGRASSSKGVIQKGGLLLLVFGQLLYGRSAFGLLAIIAASLGTSALVGWWMGHNLLVGLTFPAAVNGMVVVSAIGFWVAVWEQATNIQAINKGAIAIVVPQALAVALFLAGTGVYMGYGVMLGVGLLGLTGILCVLSFPERLAWGPIRTFLWRHGGPWVGGGAASRLPPAKFAEYLTNELLEPSQRNGVLFDDPTERLHKALKNMNTGQARALDDATWQKLLAHPNQQVRETALRASTERKGENP